MPSRRVVAELLSTYSMLLGLSGHRTHDIRLGQALRMAGAAIVLAASQGVVFRLFGVGVPIERIVPGSLLIVLTWFVCTAIFVVPRDRRARSIATNLNIASFWIAVTVFLVSAAYVLFPEGNKESLRVVFVTTTLPIFVVAHMLQARFNWRWKLFLILALCLTNGLLAWRAVLI